jgi:hypothetical protein
MIGYLSRQGGSIAADQVLYNLQIANATSSMFKQKVSARMGALLLDSIASIFSLSGGPQRNK